MAHNARRYPDSTYVTGYVATGDDFKFYDTNLTKALNGDGGGTWNPSAPIEIGGAGLMAALPATLSSGAHLLTTSDDSAIEHDDNDYILYSTSRTLASPILTGAPPRTTSVYAWELAPAIMAVLSPAKDASLQTYPEDPWAFPVRVHDGATMTGVTFSVQLGMAHTTPVAHPMRFRVMRADRDGNAAPIGTSTDADGYVAFAGNYAVTTVQTVAYACNEVIDRSKYTYHAEIVDEWGTNAWSGTSVNVFYGASADFDVTTMAPQ